jgi:radical SAM superfamily enzyme YgiQ (UPF0313 family)
MSQPTQHQIVLVGINSRYTHTSLGLRYLYANLHELQPHAIIQEYVIKSDPATIAEKILSQNPKIIGIGVYIWNATDVQDLIEIIKKIAPHTTIVLGGPEVSHKPFRINWQHADYIVQGEGEITFYTLCKDILDNTTPKQKVIQAQMPSLTTLTLPYRFYNDHDIAHRYIYVEASRGCPFACEFCLSAIDERVRGFDMDKLLAEFEELWKKGARNFKFIDRTFNLNIKLANRLMDFFLAKTEPYTLHFEVIPDNFPERLKERIKRFPPGSLQLEIGIQTLNEEILANINRRMDLQKVRENITFLEKETHAHLHLDLIIGLPGESVESFANNLNQLKAMSNSEIQIGILKKLSGTTLDRHDMRYRMIYSDKPPYEILQNDFISFAMLQKLKRFSRFWDLTYNSGNFYRTIDYLWQKQTVYDGFYAFSEWIYTQTESTWQISLMRLSELLFRYLTEQLGYDEKEIADSMVADIIRIEGRKVPGFLRQYATHIPNMKRLQMQKHQKRQILRA